MSPVDPASSLPTSLTDALHPVVERVDHIAWAVPRMEGSLPMVRMLGGVYRTGGHHLVDGFRWAQFDLPGGTSLEVLSPHDLTDKRHFLTRFVGTHGGGLHHLTIKVTALDVAIATARSQGYEIVRHDVSDPLWREAFIHPISSNGLLVQLAEFDDAQLPPPPPLDEVLGSPR